MSDPVIPKPPPLPPPPQQRPRLQLPPRLDLGLSATGTARAAVTTVWDPPASKASYPPVAFYFSVQIDGRSSDCSFQEVSGMGLTMEIEPLVEGGENRFIHQLPKGIKQGSLRLQRGLAMKDTELVGWCRQVLEGDLGRRIELKPVQVSLLDEMGQPLCVWSFENCYPVGWDIEAFNADKNEVAIEQIELAYQTCVRMK